MRKINIVFVILFCCIYGYGQTILISEGFNAGDPPTDWTKFNNSIGGDPSAAAWTIRPDGYTYGSVFVDPPRIFHSNDNSQFYLSNSDAQGGDTTETILQSPAFNTTGFSFVLLRFYHHFREYFDDTAFVEVSTNGTTWTKVASITTAPEDSIGAPNNFVQKNIPLNSYAGNAIVYIRFRYFSNGIPVAYGYYWAIDNVSVIASNSPLPVSLITFSGYKENDHNILKWSTAFEQNNRGFELERSTNGTNYSSISFIPSQALFGNSNSLLNYSFIDNNLSGDKQYYRLRQIDFDGKEKLSNIVLIKNIPPKDLIIDAVFPNPVNTVLNVFVNSPRHDDVLLQVIDMNGKMLKQKMAVTETGSNTLPIDVSSLSNGVYVLKIVSSTGETAVKRFIKQ